MEGAVTAWRRTPVAESVTPHGFRAATYPALLGTATLFSLIDVEY